MADLRASFQGLGFTNVVTYIQSGNIAFETIKDDIGKLEQDIKSDIADTFGYDIPALILPQEDIKIIISNNPFLPDKEMDVKFLHVTLLSHLPEKERIITIDGYNHKEDQFEILGKTVYIYAPGGYGKTKFNNSFFEKKLGVPATTRNWKTLNKLLDL